MPVMRAELLRSVYRNDFTTAGKLLGKMAGGRSMTFKVLKDWFMYSYQCTECRRCSVFCPYGIDTAEVTMILRELLHLVGVNTNWILEPAANSNRTGNHIDVAMFGILVFLAQLKASCNSIITYPPDPELFWRGPFLWPS